MIWKKDRLRPTQPYFVFDTDRFCQEVYLRQGISHFYTFHFNEDKCMRVVPDGCIDLVFQYAEGKMTGFACGTVLEYGQAAVPGRGELFGVRFMPAVHPQMLGITMRDVLTQTVPIREAMRGDDSWLDMLEEETDFYQRIRIFIENFTKAEKVSYRDYSSKEIVQCVKQMIYDTDGKIRVSDIQEKTGYSERYINRLFLEEMGFSPKIFCKIIQFQRALEFLNYGAPDKMTDAAVYLGYYDQPQFIRDFTKYAGLTPKRYLDMVVKENYTHRISETNLIK